MTSNRLFKTIAVAAGVSVLTFACAHEQKTEEPVTVNAPLAVVVSETMPRLQPYAGTVRASSTAQLAARIAGDVIAVHVTDGDRVKQGQILLEIDGRDAKDQVARARAGQSEIGSALEGAAAAIRSAEAQASLAESTWRRFAALRERGSVSAQEYDETEARHRSASAELERARRAHAQVLAQRDAAAAALRQADTFSSYTKIRAPFDGIVSARLVDPGTQAAPGMPLLVIDSTAKYRVEATIDEAAALTVGEEVAVESGGATVPGRVTHVVGSIDPGTRSALVKIDLPQNGSWRSGAFARVLIPVGEHRALTIPAEAIMRRGQLNMVYAVGTDDIAHLRLVTLGEAAGDRVEILSGLAAGERVVTRTTAALREGVRIAGAAA